MQKNISHNYKVNNLFNRFDPSTNLKLKTQRVFVCVCACACVCLLLSRSTHDHNTTKQRPRETEELLFAVYIRSVQSRGRWSHSFQQ